MTAGKGDTQRPFDAEKFNANFEQIFGNKAACKCSMRVKFLGDGCPTCNPNYWKQFDEEEELSTVKENEQP